MRIYKFPLKPLAQQNVTLTKKSMILSVQPQNGIPNLWAEVEVDGEGNLINHCEAMIYLLPTGCPVPEDVIGHLNTLILEDGIVMHVYEGPRK